MSLEKNIERIADALEALVEIGKTSGTTAPDKPAATAPDKPAAKAEAPAEKAEKPAAKKTAAKKTAAKKKDDGPTADQTAALDGIRDLVTSHIGGLAKGSDEQKEQVAAFKAVFKEHGAEGASSVPADKAEAVLEALNAVVEAYENGGEDEDEDEDEGESLL